MDVPDGPVIPVPRSWLLGSERSSCKLSQANVKWFLGRPDGYSYSRWQNQCIHHYRLGLSFVWECPAYFYSPGLRLDSKTKALIRNLVPVGGRWFLWLNSVRLTPRESLVEIRWTIWRNNIVLSFEKQTCR